jgi:hypothetical protein
LHSLKLHYIFWLLLLLSAVLQHRYLYLHLRRVPRRLKDEVGTD